MGAFDYTWNAIHSGQIRELDERVADLEKDMITARMWIEHLVKRIEYLERKDQLENIKAGAHISDGNGGYSIGNQEDYDEFVRKRNENRRDI